MKKTNAEYKQRKKTSLPKWLKSYHLLLFALVILFIFGAFMKHLSSL